MSEPSNVFLPPLKLPLFYLGFAILCFALALIGIIFYAQDLTGFYYHPRILAITHLVTLGWITGNILGTLYIAGPMALQMYLPARRYDVAAFVLYAVGVSGMAAHFWRDRPIGMASSAATVYVAILMIGIKVLRNLRKSRAPGFVQMHLCFAFCNLFLGGAWGLLLSVHKIHGFLPTSSYPNVIAHAHLAAVGWAAMMVFGMAYRLFPMFLPGKPVKGPAGWISGIFLELGILGLFVSVLFQSKLVQIFAVLIVIGILLFIASIIRVAIQRQPTPPPQPQRPDYSMLHAVLSFLSLVICLILGFWLMQSSYDEEALRAALAYGALGLIGFLGQLVIGLKPRILSFFTWYHGMHREYMGLPRVLDMPVRTFQIVVFFLWLAGLILLIGGILDASRIVIRSGAILLLASLILATVHEVSILSLIRSGTRADVRE